MKTSDLIEKARKRIEIRKSIPRGEPDRIAQLLEDLCTTLERYSSGYQGSCYACEPVGILNQQLRAENSHLHHQTNKLGEDVLRLRAEVADQKDAFNKLNEMLAESLEDRDRLREAERRLQRYRVLP